jgi:streptogramin lyase
MNISSKIRSAFLHKVFLILSAVFIFTGSAGADEIFKVTGTGTAGYTGDGGPAVTAQVSNPRSVAVDSLGNVYIADSANDVIRRIAPDGTISTFAGTGTPGFTDTSDGMSQAANHPLDDPTGVAVDAMDNVYIADQGNHIVRKVDGAGIITTIAGSGGLTFDPADDGQPAVDANLRNPYAVDVAPNGNVYILDRGNNSANGGPRVRVVDAITGLIDTAAGDGDPAGSGGDGGPATQASFDSPYGIYVDANENIYVADAGNDVIRRIDNATGNISTFAGVLETPGSGGDGGLATDAGLQGPRGVAGDAAGNIYIADYNNNDIRRVDVNGIIETVAGTGFQGYNGDGRDPLLAHMNHPIDLAAAAGGLLYVVEFTPDRVRVIGPNSLNNPVTDITLDRTPEIDDDDPPDTVVARLTGVDADVEGHDFSLVAGPGDTDNALFNISGVRLRANDPSAMAPGLYSVRIDADDDNDSNFQKEFVITVSSATGPDTTPPVITLNGSAAVNINRGTAYADAGATATDDTDGDITADIVTTSNVNTNANGTYQVTYDVVDTAGNAAVQVVRTVTVVEPPAPPPPAPTPSSGGGSFGALGLLFLMTMFARRRFFVR